MRFESGGVKGGADGVGEVGVGWFLEDCCYGLYQ